MPHHRQVGFPLVLAFVLVTWAAPAWAWEPEMRLSLIALDGYGANLDEPGLSLGSFGSRIDGGLYRWAELLGGGLLGGAAAVSSQEEIPPPWRRSEPSYPEPVDPYAPAVVTPISNEIGVSIFTAAVAGVAMEDIFEDLDYADIFDVGTGYRVVWRLHIHRERAPGRVFSWGPMAMIDTVTFDGDTTDELFYVPSGCDGLMDFDELTITKILGGIHLRNTFGSFFLGFHFGIGVAIISEVTATWDESACSGAPPWEIEFYADEVTFGMDVEARLGWKWALGGGSASMSAYCIFGFGVNGPPEEGEDAPGTEPGPMAVAYLGLGLSFEFGGGGGGVQTPTPYGP